MDENLKFKGLAIFGNVISWLVLLFSLAFAFGSMFAGDAFGTGLYNEFQEKVIMLAIYMALLSPVISLAGAIASLVMVIIKKFTIALWLCAAPIIFILISILLFTIAGH